MLFGRKKSPGKNDAPQPESAEEVRSPEGTAEAANSDHVVGTEMWLELAKIEQEVAELAQAVATRQQEAEQLWLQTGETSNIEEAKGASITAWRLEKEVLQLAERALHRAKGELHADLPSGEKRHG